MLRYHVEIDDLHAHRWRVSLRLQRPLAQQVLALPAWAPGSYTLRHFARGLSQLEVTQQGRRCDVRPMDTHRWQVDCRPGVPLQAQWRILSRDASVRSAWLDAEHGFFNASSLLLRAEGHETAVHQLGLGPLPRGWQVATSMARAAAASSRRGPWQAQHYHELIDHPFLMGSLWQGEFQLRGVTHRVAVQGAWPGYDGERLLKDLSRLCAGHAALWHGPRGALPFKAYQFLLLAGEQGGGGLEHRDSTALQVARSELPRQGMAEAHEGYTELLSLASHEYFHAWNVKRLQPAGLSEPDLQRENPSALLWFFEGVTSYYDELLLCRTGLQGASRYLRMLARQASQLADSPGRRVHSVADAGREAWIKYYHRDEHSPNLSLSYYSKGALVALLLDAALRASERRGATLDAVMRRLWQQRQASGPIDERHIAAALQAVGGRSFEPELAAWVHGTAELPLAESVATLGLVLQHERAGVAARLGLVLRESALGGVQVRHVLDGGAAQAAGVAAGDELLAVDDWRIRRLDDAQAWLAPQAAFNLLLARGQRVLRLRVRPEAAAALPGPVQLVLAERPGAAVLRRRQAWLGV